MANSKSVRIETWAWTVCGGPYGATLVDTATQERVVLDMIVTASRGSAFDAAAREAVRRGMRVV